MGQSWDPAHSRLAPRPVTLPGVPWLSVMGSLTPSVSSSGLENTTKGQSLRSLRASLYRPSQLWGPPHGFPPPPEPPHLSCRPTPETAGL